MPHAHQHSLAQADPQLQISIGVDDDRAVTQSTSIARLWLPAIERPVAVNLDRLFGPFATLQHAYDGVIFEGIRKN